MKRLIILGALLVITCFHNVYAFENVDIGISLVTTESDSYDTPRVRGVIFMTYDGYDYALSDTMNLNIIPTSAEVSVNGDKVVVYTDVATLNYYGIEGLELAASAIQVDYKKIDDFVVEEREKVALVDLQATKFFAVGSLEIDLTAAASLGGYTKTKFNLLDENLEQKETHYATVDVSVGINIPVTDTKDILLHAGKYREFDENTMVDGHYAGVAIYGFEIADKYPVSLEFNYVESKYGLQGAFEDVTATKFLFGISISF